MATSFTVTNPIGVNGASSVPASSALGLKLFSGEVIAAFDRVNKALGMVKVRTISGGTSSQFIVSGQASDTSVAAHTAGADVAASVLKVNERVITINQRYYYSSFVDDLDMKLSQWEVRGELAKQAAEALSTKIDKEIFAGIEAFISNGANAVADQDNGAVITIDISGAATPAAKGDAIIEGLFAAQATLDGKDVPSMDRQFITTAQNYYYLVQSTNGVNADYTSGNGGIDSGRVMKIAGLTIQWSNHLPTTATNTFALHGMVFTPDVYGVVKAMDVTSEANYIPEKLGSLLTSYYALGHGGLNPGAGVVITENSL